MIVRGRLWFVVVVALAVVAIGGAAAWWHWQPRPATVAAAAVSLEPADVDFTPTNPGYLGPQACAECHAQRVAEFLKTRHALACVEPSPDRVTRTFDSGPNQ